MTKSVLKKKLGDLNRMDLQKLLAEMVDEMDECGPQRLSVAFLDENQKPVAAMILLADSDIRPYIEALGTPVISSRRGPQVPMPGELRDISDRLAMYRRTGLAKPSDLNGLLDDAAAALREVAAFEMEMSVRLHYPQCWDTATYPTLTSALRELADCYECREKQEGLFVAEVDNADE